MKYIIKHRQNSTVHGEYPTRELAEKEYNNQSFIRETWDNRTVVQETTFPLNWEIAEEGEE